jgi:hypothetical protein
VIKLLKRIRDFFRCLVWHDWTSRVQQKAPIDRAEFAEDPAGYFIEYSRMYCARPGCKAVFPEKDES